MMKLEPSKIRGIFVLTDILYREIGYSEDYLFGDKYIDKNDIDHIVLEIKNEKFYSCYNWVVEIARKEIDNEDSEIDSEINNLIKASSIEELSTLVESEVGHFNDYLLLIYRDKSDGNWTCKIYYGVDEDFEEEHDPDFDPYDETEADLLKTPLEPEDPLEKAISDSLPTALNRLESILESKIKE